MKVLPGKVVEISIARNCWRVVATDGQTLNDFKNPDAWSGCVNKLRRMDKVEIIANDGSWYAEGIVTMVKLVSVEINFYLDTTFETAHYTADNKLPFRFEHRGRGIFAIIRNETGEIVESDIQGKSEAAEICKRYNGEALAEA